MEIEFDQQALTAPGCCRFVPVVVRLCGIPTHQHVMLTVMFERTRKRAKDGTACCDDYEVHPASYFLVQKGIPGYQEYVVDLLARILAQRMVNTYWHSDLAAHSACLDKQDSVQ